MDIGTYPAKGTRVASIGLLLLLAFTINLPLGWWRSRRQKFSPSWFLAIHASIPVLVATRFALGLSLWIIPAEIALAVVGQVTGARADMAG
jgi:hypothetical protein